MDVSIQLKGKKPKEEVVAIPQRKHEILVPYISKKNKVEESLKAKILPDVERAKYELKNNEVAHPFDFKLLIDLYKRYGFVTGVIDKHVDFVVSSSFYVTSKEKRAEDIISNYLQEVNFDFVLRAWLKTALITGNGFLEVSGREDEVPEKLMVLDPCYIYIRRDEEGNILGYSQIIKANEKPIELSPENIIHLAINTVGDNAYGYGIIQPGMIMINHLTKAQTDMHVIQSRKANSPYIFTVGVPEKDIMPTQAELDAIGHNLEYLNNKQEWVVDGSVKVSTVDFGKAGDKFEAVLKHDEDHLFFTFQVPEVLMGRGNVPEGLAKVQLEAWQKRVQSIQSEIEKVIETELFSRVLRANGLEGIHVEFEWGEKSEEDKIAEITRITELLKLPKINDMLRNELENKLALLMGFEIDMSDAQAERKKEEQEQKQPQVPMKNPRAHTHSDVEETIQEEIIYNGVCRLEE